MTAPSDDSRDSETGHPAELGERRARRAAETGLIERAERAERTVIALERRLDEAEGRLEVAQRERTILGASLEQAQRDLTSAQQREFAEHRMRLEAESEVGGELAELEAEITRVGADHDAAEARATALARALEEARHEVDTARARAQADRQAVAVDASRDGLRLELGELQALAEDLQGTLAGERAAREQAERALLAERERASAEVTLLQHELDRRGQGHDAVSTQIAELRTALDAVRARAERGEALEQAIATLEGEQRRTSVRLADTRELLATREAELIAVEDRLAAREAELEILRDEAERHRAARREAEETVASIRARSAELGAELDEERQSRLRVEERLEAERRRFAGTEQELHAELDSRREASDQRLAATERIIDALRAELAAAATELDERVVAERTARLAVERELELERRDRSTEHEVRRTESETLARRLEAVESELADTQAAAARERTRADRAEAEVEANDPVEDRARAERAESARAELAAELAGHAEREQRVGHALAALREELEQVRADDADRAGREAAVERLVADLIETAHGFRVGFERELEELAAARDAELAQERQGFAATRDAELARERQGFADELAGMEQRVGGLRRQLTAAAEQLRDELEEERSARWLAEAELAQEVAERSVAEGRTGRALDALTSEVERLREAQQDNPIYGAPPVGPRMPSSDHPALSRPAGAPAGAPAVVSDLARAMDRLRGSDAAAPADLAPMPVDEGDPRDDDPGPVAFEDDAEDLATENDDAVEPAESEVVAVDPAASEPETQVPATVVVPPALASPSEPAPTNPPDLVAPAAVQVTPLPGVTQSSTAWFGPRLAGFARTDEAAAERVLLSALEAQGPSAARRVVYELELPLSGRYRVEVVPGERVSVARTDDRHPRDVDFRLEGPVAALTPLAGGAAPRRLSGVTVHGRRRRLRRLLRSLRAPVGLDELRGVGAEPSPADLLALLCDGVAPAAVAGADFTVAYDVTDPGGESARTVVRARPDAPLVVAADDGSVPDASVALDGNDLLSVLSGSFAVVVTGDHHAVETLHGWFRAVQG